MSLAYRRRTEVVVPSLALWERVRALPSDAPSRPRRPLRERMLLYAAAAGSTVALARPIVERDREGPPRLTILLDRSARMGARLEGGATPIRLAVAYLRRLRGRYHASGPVPVWLYPRLKRRTLDEILAGRVDLVPEAGDIGEALATVGRSGGLVLVITDRGDAVPSSGRVRIAAVAAGRGENLALERVVLERAEMRDDGDRWTLLTTLANLGPSPRRVRVVLVVAPGRRTELATVSIAPGARQVVRRALDLGGARRLSVVLENPDGGPLDALPADDACHAARTARLAVRVRGRLDAPVLALLRGLDRVDLGGRGEPALEISSGVCPSPGPWARLVIDPPRPPAGLSYGEPILSPHVTGWRDTGELAGLDLSSLAIRRARSLRGGPGDFEILVWSGSHMLVGRRARDYLCLFSWEARQSNWTRHPSFPLMLRNLVRTLAPAAGRFVATAHAVGTGVAARPIQPALPDEVETSARRVLVRLRMPLAVLAILVWFAWALVRNRSDRTG